MSKGEMNVYICEKCKRMAFTVDRDEGTTPFMIQCTDKCGGMMQSQFYPLSIPPHVWPEYEWYKPKNNKHRDAATRDHIERGGLLMRKLEPNRAEAIVNQRMTEVLSEEPSTTNPTYEAELKARLEAMTRERDQLREIIDRNSIMLEQARAEVAKLQEWRDDAINLYPDLERISSGA